MIQDSFGAINADKIRNKVCKQACTPLIFQLTRTEKRYESFVVRFFDIAMRPGVEAKFDDGRFKKQPSIGIVMPA